MFRFNSFIRGLSRSVPKVKSFRRASIKAPKMEYKVIPEDRFDEVVDHLRSTFFSDEPLNKAAGLSIPNDYLEHHTYHTLEENMSIMAVTGDNEIAGVILNGSVYPGDYEEALNILEQDSDEKIKKIFRLLFQESINADFFQRFQADKIYELRILSVSPKFRGQGIAKSLVEHAISEGKDHGYKIAKADATGFFSQKILKSNGFNTVLEKYYDKYADTRGEPILHVQSPHIKLQILYKIID